MGSLILIRLNTFKRKKRKYNSKINIWLSFNINASNLNFEFFKKFRIYLEW